MNRRDAIKAVMAMPGLTAVSRADLKPNDVIVMEFAGLLTPDAGHRIKAIAEAIWPGHKCVVLDQGMTIKVVRDGVA